MRTIQLRTRALQKSVILIIGVSTSLYAWGCIAMLGLYVATSKLSDFGVSMATANEDHEILFGQLQLYLVSCAIPLFWFGLVFLRRSRFFRVWWLLLFMCIFQWVLARVCVFFIEKFSGHWNYEGTAEVYPTFAEVRHGLSVIESTIYAPTLYLVEHGYGTLALVLHSLVLATLLTGILYALVRIYRMWRRPPAAGETEAVCRLSEEAGQGPENGTGSALRLPDP